MSDVGSRGTASRHDTDRPPGGITSAQHQAELFDMRVKKRTNTTDQFTIH